MPPSCFCRAPKCGRPAYYGFTGAKLTMCSRHKMAGMVSRRFINKPPLQASSSGVHITINSPRVARPAPSHSVEEPTESVDGEDEERELDQGDEEIVIINDKIENIYQDMNEYRTFVETVNRKIDIMNETIRVQQAQMTKMAAQLDALINRPPAFPQYPYPYSYPMNYNPQDTPMQQRAYPFVIGSLQSTIPGWASNGTSQ